MEPGTRAWLTERIDPWVAIGVGVSWLVLTPIAMALEPSTDRSEPLIGMVLANAMQLLLLAMLVGLALCMRWGIAASLAGAVFATAMTVACPVSGHHQFGAWWYGQMLCALLLVAISVAALPRQAAPHRHQARTRESDRSVR
jgi:hypothetical protein